MVQESVIVVEDVPFGDGVIAVMISEFCQCPIGDVFLSVGAILIVGVKRETLCPTFAELENLDSGILIGNRTSENLMSYSTNTNYLIFPFSVRCREIRYC